MGRTAASAKLSAKESGASRRARQRTSRCNSTSCDCNRRSSTSMAPRLSCRVGPREVYSSLATRHAPSCNSKSRRRCGVIGSGNNDRSRYAR